MRDPKSLQKYKFTMGGVGGGGGVCMNITNQVHLFYTSELL